MDSNFTGLVLVTGESAPNIENEILETLSPFVITILDKQSMDIRGRYFLAIHFSLDKAHAKAIEKDLLNTAEKIGVDLVVDYQ
jgi:predicted amino acid-binding ACT domain protein